MEFNFNIQEAEKIFGQHIAATLAEVDELKNDKQKLLCEAKKREIRSKINGALELIYYMEKTKETSVESYLKQRSSESLCTYIAIAKEFGFELTDEVMLDMMQKAKVENEDN